MGTSLDLVISGTGQEEFDIMVRQVGAELDRIEAKLSIYRHDSVLTLLNSTAFAGSIEVDAELRDIFQEAIRLYGETKGYFDITVKPVSDYIRNRDEPVLHLPEEVRDCVGMTNVELEEGGIRYAKKGVTVDLGGFGKGYAVKRLLPVFGAFHIPHLLISFGGSLIYGFGSHPAGKPWKVSVPSETGSEDASFDLKDEALSTSGNSLNNRKKFGNSGHIVNPVTLRMVKRPGMVCVKSADPVEAEVYSTALFSAGPEKTDEILSGRTGLEARWILPENP